MKTLMRYLKIYRVFIVQELKRMMEYKVDFIIGVVSVLAQQAANLLFIWVIFSRIPALDGFTMEQIIFIYGFSLLPRGLDHLLFDNLWPFGYWLVNRGEFDRYLTRPLPTLMHVMFERFQVDALGSIIIGIVLIISVMGSIGIVWSLGNILLFLFIIPFATLIYTALKIATAAIAMWTKQSGHVIMMFYRLSDFAPYPTSIFPSVIRGTITYIIPFAFASFYPASYFLTGENPWFRLGGTVVVSLLMLAIALFIWRRGEKAYESAGS